MITDRINPDPDECKKYPSDLNELCCFLAAEGHKLLEKESKSTSSSKKSPEKNTPKILETKLGSMSPNPYIKARIEILTKWTNNPDKKWKVSEIERMEKEGDTENRFYQDFAHEVRVLADSKYTVN